MVRFAAEVAVVVQTGGLILGCGWDLGQAVKGLAVLGTERGPVQGVSPCGFVVSCGSGSQIVA